MRMHPLSSLQQPKVYKTIIAIIVVALVIFLINEKKRQDGNFVMTADGGASSTGGTGYDYDVMAPQGMPSKGLAREESQFYGRANSVAPMMPPMPGGSAPLTDVMQDDRYVVRNAYVSAVAADVSAAVSAITAKAKEWSGFITSSSLYDVEKAPSASISLRVPVEQFDAALQYLRSTYRVVNETVSGEDVTEQVVDNEARLKTLKASEAQFLEIMKKATRVEDVLSVQQQLERVRGEIESLSARQEYLKRSAALSTITVNLSTELEQLPIVDPSEKWSPLATFKQAIRDFRLMIQHITDFFIANSLNFVAIVLCYAAYRLWRRAHG